MTNEGSGEQLERRYRRLLRALPAPQRAAREEEMVAVLLQAATPSQSRPTVSEAADLLALAARSRLRCLFIDPVARLGVAVAMLLTIAAAVAAHNVAASRTGNEEPSATAGPVLPDRFPAWDPPPARADRSPAGAASMAYLDGDEDGTHFLVLIGAEGTSARQVPDPTGSTAAPDGVSADSTNTPFLLAPDGRQLAVRRGHSLQVLDLTNGRIRTVPGLELADSARLLAWSLDGTRIAVSSATGTDVVDVSNGFAVHVTEAATSAAFAPDGRLALASRTRLDVFRADGRRIGGDTMPPGWDIAAAGWSPDGQILALRRAQDSSPDVVPTGTGTIPYQRRPASQPIVHIAAEGNVPALLAPPDPSAPLAWNRGRLLLESDSGSVTSWNPVTGQKDTVIRTREGVYCCTIASLQLATNVAARARIVPLDALDRGPLGLFWPLLAALFSVAALVRGWWYTRTHLVHPTTSVRAAVVRAIPWALAATAAGFPVGYFYLMLSYPLGREAHLLHLTTTLAAAAAYTFGRSLGRARKHGARPLGAGSP